MLKYMKLVVAILLVVIFLILFGLDRIQLLTEKGVVISKLEETPSEFPSPGDIWKLTSFELIIFLKGIFIKAIPSTYLPASCTLNVTNAASFRECVFNNKTAIIKDVHFNSYKQIVFMNLFDIHDVILPAHGSLKYGYEGNLTIPAFELNCQALVPNPVPQDPIPIPNPKK